MDGLGPLQAVAQQSDDQGGFIILTAQGDRALVTKAAALVMNNALAAGLLHHRKDEGGDRLAGALKRRPRLRFAVFISFRRTGPGMIRTRF